MLLRNNGGVMSKCRCKCCAPRKIDPDRMLEVKYLWASAMIDKAKLED